ncbi:UDP-N-acetylmuramate--L-alanine ligase [Candidatus Parcubacteria bacterium]|nr:MAG: UDP-N-acetylmuramate--L-alanine ligase [Candidatus Parcubacteria bacterium]
MIQAKNVFIIGIGGIGTSAAAKWWKAQGAKVSGSDVYRNGIVHDLENEGIKVYLGHSADNIPFDCDLVIHSRAVPVGNVERQVAAERGILDISYPEFLGELSKLHKTIAVSGTNGKSTTTAMIASVLIEANLDPTVVLGSKMADWPHKNLRIGNGDLLVTEACEHMASFLNIMPDIAIVTNIEEDHLDFYRDLDQIRDTFQLWIDKAKNAVVINKRDKESQKLKIKKKIEFDYSDRVVASGKQKFVVDGDEYELSIPGEFNVQNAAAAIAVGRYLQIKPEIIRNALVKFKGTWRRFEKVGLWKGAEIYSDYAHHPTAIRGAIRAFKEFFPDRRLIVVFQPHQHSRTHELFAEFVKSFDEADIAMIMEVYEVAGRTEEKYESGQDLVDEMKNLRKIPVYYVADIKKAENKLRDLVKKDDIIVCMGAGSIDELARKLV